MAMLYRSGLNKTKANALAALTVAEVQILDGATLTTAEINKLAGIGSTQSEIDNMCDKSARKQELTESGAVSDWINIIELNHATVAIDATIQYLDRHPGLLIIRDTSASGTAAHTVTIGTAGETFDGTNNKATFNAPGETLLIYVPENVAADGVLFKNIGSVAMSAV